MARTQKNTFIHLPLTYTRRPVVSTFYIRSWYQYRTIYYLEDQIKDAEVGRAYGMHEGGEKHIQSFGGKPERIRPRGSLWHQLPVAGSVPVYPSHRHPVFTSTCGSAASTRWGRWWWQTIPSYNCGSWGTGHQEWGYSLLDARKAEVKFSLCVTLHHSETCIMRPAMCAFGITGKGPQQYRSSVVGSHIWTVFQNFFFVMWWNRVHSSSFVNMLLVFGLGTFWAFRFS